MHTHSFERRREAEASRRFLYWVWTGCFASGVSLLPEGSGKSSGLPGLVPADGFPVSPGRASSFSHARKGTKSAHRGTNPSDKGRPPGFDPLRTPGLRGRKIGAVSYSWRASSTLSATQDGLRPFSDLTCHSDSRLWAPGAGVQACGSAPLTAQAPKCPAQPGGYPGPQVPKHTPYTSPEGVGGTGAAASHARRKARLAPLLTPP